LAWFEVSPADNRKSFVLTVGDELIVALPENPTTGYRWELDSPGAPLRLERDEFAAGGAPGAGGTRRLTFRASTEGRAHLTLKLRREWEKTQPPTEQFSVTADVRSR